MAEEKVVRRFKITAVKTVVREVVYEVDAYNEEQARMQVEHNTAILNVQGRNKDGAVRSWDIACESVIELQ